MSHKPENPDIAAVTVSHNSNLRDRIAAALYRNCGKDSGIPDLQMAWNDAFPIVRGHWLEMADAVIRELGLEPQVHYDPDCEFYRYVTDWKADDE